MEKSKTCTIAFVDKIEKGNGECVKKTTTRP